MGLIPKVVGAKSFSNFRLISLCNTLYKIVAKVLANLLKLVLLFIIDPNQGGFIKGHQILDGIITIHKVIYNNKSGKEAMYLKLDMNKAFNRMSWKFFLMVLRIFSVHED